MLSVACKDYKIGCYLCCVVLRAPMYDKGGLEGSTWHGIVKFLRKGALF